MELRSTINDLHAKILFLYTMDVQRSEALGVWKALKQDRIQNVNSSSSIDREVTQGNEVVQWKLNTVTWAIELHHFGR